MLVSSNQEWSYKSYLEQESSSYEKYLLKGFSTYQEYNEEVNLTPDERISKIRVLNPKSDLTSFNFSGSCHYNRSLYCDSLRYTLSKIALIDTEQWKEAVLVCVDHFQLPVKILKSFEKKEEQDISTFNYALSRFSDQLEKISGLPFSEIKMQCLAYGIEYIIHHYFDSVSDPTESDSLITYWKDKKSLTSGICKTNGFVELKWNTFESGRYAYEHPMFFLPEHMGDEVTFSRPKLCCVNDLNPRIYLDESNEQKRNMIDELIDTKDYQKLTEVFPEIEYVESNKCFGTCYFYAFGKTLKTYRLPPGLSEWCWKAYIDEHFFPVDTPQEGDLAVYYDYKGGKIVHFGVYRSDHRIESKWGCHPVFYHPPLMTTKEYGTHIAYFRPNQVKKYE